MDHSKYIFLQHLASVCESLPDRTDGFDDHNNSDGNTKKMTHCGRGRRGRGATTAGRGRGRGAGEKGKSTRGTSRKKTSGGMADELWIASCSSPSSFTPRPSASGF